MKKLYHSKKPVCYTCYSDDLLWRCSVW